MKFESQSKNVMHSDSRTVNHSLNYLLQPNGRSDFADSAFLSHQAQLEHVESGFLVQLFSQPMMQFVCVCEVLSVCL